jgi:membrane fusion protein (multidrug efflux system)
LTGLFPNPGNTLRPGQYAKIHAAIGMHAGALLVPQRSVIDTQGTYTVAVVDPNNTVRFAVVQVGDRVGANWIIDRGLKPGERVVTDGLFQVRPGAAVSPKGGK